MGGGYPNLIREILYAPPAPPTCLALIEVALSYHNSSQYEAAIDAYQQARNDWIEMEGYSPIFFPFFDVSINMFYFFCMMIISTMIVTILMTSL